MRVAILEASHWHVPLYLEALETLGVEVVAVSDLEQNRGKPAYVLLIDGPWKEPYWRERYPALVDPHRRIHRARAIKWLIGVYPAH